MESEHPYLQIGDKVFRGTFHTTIGDQLVFLKRDVRHLEYQGSTTRRLLFTPILLEQTRL
jgi:hypothetical protein